MSRRGRRFRAVTWNVHGCIGSAGRFDPDAVIDALRSLEPDVVSLQEVDSRAGVADGLDTFGYLQRGLGFNAFDVRTIETEHGDYGHMLLTPWTIESTRRLDLSVGGFEPRAAISLAVRELGVRVISTHLGLRVRERQLQVERIVGEVDRLRDEPVLVLGDFNEWRRIGVTTRKLCPPFSEAAAVASFPAWRPVFSLDRIWCGPGLESSDGRAVRAMAHLSDHLPVVADLRPAEPG